jgi:hypothetical protein
VSTDEAFRTAASWIWSGEGVGRRLRSEDGATYEVRLFRRGFDVSNADSARLVAHVTADSHYELFVNGVLVGDGPAKGDLRHHFFESYDLSKWLRRGRNCLAVRVVDFSPVQCDPPRLGAPGSVMTYHGGLAVDASLAEGSDVTSLKTDESWSVRRDGSRQFQADDILHGGFVGYFERWFCAEALEDWAAPEAEGTEWRSARVLYPAVRFADMRDSDSPYGLLPRGIARQQEASPLFFARSSKSFLGEKIVAGEEVTLEPDASFECILDTGHLETAFPLLDFSGGQGSTITLTYAEALRLPWNSPGAKSLGRQIDLGNVGTGFKDESTGWTYDLRGTLAGYSDFVHPDGRAHHYRPMHWRTFRFVRLRVQVGSEPLTIRRLSFAKIAYPFPQLAHFESESPFFNALWRTGVRTMELCCHETFEDCPYYEQLQYCGDSSVTSRLALFVGGECDLTKQAIRHFDWSRLPEGLTQSRYPSRIPQIIPAFSLHWIEMIRDYYLYTADLELVREVRVGMEAVLGWFQRHCGNHGLPERLPYWNMTDWCGDWKMGQPPGWDTGPTSTISGLYIRALRDVAWLLGHLGETEAAAGYERRAEVASMRFRELFWNEEESLFQDQPIGDETASYSQYGNALAVLSGAADASQREGLAKSFPFAPHLARASFFGLAAVCESLVKLGRAAQVPEIFEKWREMMDFGLDTWAEDTSYWRSLCHAWSAHPCLSLLQILGGLEVLEPGFAKISISPQSLGTTGLNFSLPTPKGRLQVGWKSIDGKITELNVVAPEGVQVQGVGDDR